MISEELSKRFKILDKTEKLKVAEKHNMSYGYIKEIINRERFNKQIVDDLLKMVEIKEKQLKHL